MGGATEGGNVYNTLEGIADIDVRYLVSIFYELNNMLCGSGKRESGKAAELVKKLQGYERRKLEQAELSFLTLGDNGGDKIDQLGEKIESSKMTHPTLGSGQVAIGEQKINKDELALDQENYTIFELRGGEFNQPMIIYVSESYKDLLYNHLENVLEVTLLCKIPKIVGTKDMMVLYDLLRTNPGYRFINDERSLYKLINEFRQHPINNAQ